ncbi:Aromatic amino acid aminotransferase C56E4.03 [Colletotrichum gloeosporioides]|uniref:Aromatic amino acid aminotransferase C56E4.03 n=1 Tax=Colletotrichum gloeosporioides TaxID=474922 RepID=A0A8H4C515_COLGL|nr:Aromatic amino acid aminotransferase C56E4.03 [Colletotrichum gloeosporioides]KAF3797529.1 Aromatic amino acid aminotransferase C56E4.03 [Colletotrichum gloeosporioides]
MGSIDRFPSNVDLSHHINAKSKARHPSPLKDIIKFMGYDGMISFAGGLPHPSLFPLEEAKFSCLTPEASLAGDRKVGAENPDILSLTLGRGASPGDLELSQFLQYGSGAGNRQLVELARELTETVHAPPCDYECLLHPGNTNAWAKIVGLLCEENDLVLVEEFTYPSAQALWIPLGIKAVPIPADADGILAQDLRSTLQNWDAEKRGGPRPRVLYLVSVGSNPTGITITAQRRREIYDVCVEFDIIIVEDDPYYFLQFPGYLTPKEPAFQRKPTKEFLKNLVPTFLSMDVQGRVIRLESFSKTLFPGLRMGYFVANPVFTERLLRATEVETQDPAGLSQALVLGLLRRWGIDGYLTWLQSLQFQYRERRDWLLDAFHARFVVLPAAKSPVPQAQGLVACVRSQQSGELRPVFSFVDPGAGMFVWCKFYFDGIDEFMDMEKSGASKDPEKDFADELWKAWATELVLLTPGSYYHAWQGPDMTTTKARGADPRTAHFRFSFATPTKEQIDTGVERLSKVVERYWR